MMSVWACYAGRLPSAVATPCNAHGEGQRGAEDHTRQTGHPTITGSPEGIAWALPDTPEDVVTDIEDVEGAAS